MKEDRVPIVSFLRPLSARGLRACVAMRKNPWVQFASLLFLRVLFRPYVGLVHDAKLYALQVANRVQNNWFRDDLFFAYGSQDSYSLISAIIHPLATLLDVRLAFIAAYILSMALLIFAELRLMRLLFGNTYLAIFSTAALVAFDHPYGGRNVFHVHEPFFTARLPAEAFSLLGLSLLWQLGMHESTTATAHRAGFVSCVSGVLLNILATLFHPLMGIGGLAVSLGILSSRAFSQRVLNLAVFTLLGLVGLFGLTPEGWIPSAVRQITGEWEISSRIVSPHCYLSEWHAVDVIHNAIIMALLFATSWRFGGCLGDLSKWVAILGVFSVAIAWLADRSGIALLIAGQAYRGLWLPSLFLIPVTLHWYWHCRQSRMPGLVLFGNALMAYVLAKTASLDGCQHVLLIFGFLTCGECVVNWLAKGNVQAVPRAPANDPVDAGSNASVSGAALGLLVIFLCFLSVTNLFRTSAFFGQMRLDPLMATWIAFRFVSPVVMALASFYFLGHLQVIRQISSRVSVLIGCWLLGNLAAGVLLENTAFRSLYDPAMKSLAFVRSTIGSDPHKAQTIYWPFHSLNTWIDLNANAYHEFTQVSGIVFSEKMSAESRRRVQSIARLEVAAMPYHVTLPGYWDCVVHYMRLTRPVAAPSIADLCRSAKDPLLDWIVLPYSIDGAQAITDGNLFIYDCDDLRMRGAAVPPTARLLPVVQSTQDLQPG